jgi:hypothetical protein
MKPKSPLYRNNLRRRVRCQSGLMGERSRLQSRYSSLEEWQNYSEVYGLANRLGYDSAAQAWANDPVIESSVKPEDFRVVCA